MQLTVRIPDEYRPQLDRLVREMGLKRSDVIRMAIKEFLVNHSSEHEYPFNKVKNLVGIAESGIDDLGQNHRKYLLERIKADEEPFD